MNKGRPCGRLKITLENKNYKSCRSKYICNTKYKPKSYIIWLLYVI